MKSYFLLLALGTVVLSAAGGCSDDGGDGAGSGGAGAVDCWPKSDACYIAGRSGPGAECLAQKNNAGATKWQGRLTSIQVVKPSNLTLTVVQRDIINKGVDILECDPSAKGEGTFSWMFEIDSETKMMRTGGGLPISDPKAGGCFVTMPNQPLPIAPIEVPVTIDGLSFSASGIDVSVPIFTSPTDTTNPIILPLHAVTIGGTFSDDSHNCIGHFLGDELLPEESCAGTAWTSGGQLEGYITIEEADQVYIEELTTTLCVFLAGIGGGWKGSAGNCATSDKWLAGDRPKGDWCSTTNAAGDAACSDAWHLEAGFAAAGFPVNGDCP
jgi:hypothetical protein